MRVSAWRYAIGRPDISSDQAAGSEPRYRDGLNNERAKANRPFVIRVLRRRASVAASEFNMRV
jgi:hypothetical protein